MICQTLKLRKNKVLEEMLERASRLRLHSCLADRLVPELECGSVTAPQPRTACFVTLSGKLSSPSSDRRSPLLNCTPPPMASFGVLQRQLVT